MNIKLFSFLICIFIMLSPAWATATEQKAVKKIVLQLTDNSPEKQALILNVADNLVDKYKNSIDLEIVAFGPGLQLLFAESSHNMRVSKLAKQGVRFSACRNTAKKMEGLLGKELELHKYAKSTDGGAARIIDLVEKGYVLLRP